MERKRAVTMTLPESMVNYLDKQANEAFMNRSVYVTNVIAQKMKKENHNG